MHPPSPTDLVTAHGLCKRYGDEDIVTDVSLTVKRGEIVTLIGPNGAGKTTLLKLLLGLEKPDRGHIHHAPGLKIGYVPQHFTPKPTLPLTVQGLLELSPHGNDTQAIAAVLAELGIAHLAHRPLQALSGGERQRALLARAWLGKPDLLVLDEPVQGVDIAGQGEMYKRIRTLADTSNTAVLMVSHDLFVVMAATHRVLCLNRHICCEGEPSHVGAHPEFVALFGQDIASQLATYAHHHDHHHTLHGEVVPGDHTKGCTHA